MSVIGCNAADRAGVRKPAPAFRHQVLGGKGRHVLMTVDAVGGIWTYGIDLGAELCRRGFRVTLAVLGPSAGSDQRRQAEERGLVVVNTSHPPDWLAPDEAAVQEAGAAVASLAKLLGVDLIHLNHPALAAAGRFDRPVVAVCHSCVASWWEATRDNQLPEDFRWRTVLVGRGLEAADALVAPSQAFAEATRRLYSLAAPPLVVPNGRTPAGPSRESIARTVFTAGRLWDEGKNVATLDRVAAWLPAPVEAAGALAGPNGASIRLEHIRALGSLDEAGLRARLARRPIFVSLALYEPFGLAVLEAAQAGCALVLSAIPSFVELWGDAADLVPPHDEQAIKAAIERLLADPDLSAERGRAAQSRAQAYTMEAMVAGTERAYQAALDTRRRRRESAA